MKGLDIAREFYLTFGKPAIEENFPKYKERIAVGLAGEGSECFGFDDEISTDHDFEAGFCLWVNEKDYEEFGFKLERMYSKLPKEFKGLKRQPLSPVGGNRRGVMIIGDFYRKFLGKESAPEESEHWLSLPTFALAAACNGEVFCDESGEFSAVRNELLKGYPEDVRLKKIAAHLILMLQSGQYNYSRLVKRKENGAAQLAVFEFVKHTISVIYLLNNKYEPFYKWAYKGMRSLEILGNLEDALVSLTELGNSKTESTAKTETIDEICNLIVAELKVQGLTDSESENLEKHAISVQNKIKDPFLRNMHIMDGI